MPHRFPPGLLLHGMQLPTRSQSSPNAEGWEADATADDLAAIARTS
ncbi:hypothetical protein [Streptomyces sp. NPDC093149]